MIEKRVEAARLLAEYSVKLDYEDIPADVRESTKRCILDTLGVSIPASTQGEGYRELIELIKDGGGKEESTIIGFGGRVPAWMAAFANGAMARALDFDDVHDDAVTHPSSTTVPAAFAIAERIKNVNGRELITAVTLGNDITCRMGLSLCQGPEGWKPGWFPSTVHGVFGAAAACGRLLGLDVTEMQNAFGIALYQSAGTLEALNGGLIGMIIGMATGLAAKAAVISALMSEKGITGARNSLEGKDGLYNLYFGGDYSRDLLVGDLGSKFQCAGISIKPWPGVRMTHSYIDATLQLMREHNISAEDIKHITASVAGWIQTLCEPLDAKLRPSNRYEASASLPYIIAVAATKRRVLNEDFSPAAIKESATLEFARKVIHKFDTRFSISNKIGPAMVEIELINGKSYSKQMDIAYGHPRNPMTWQDFTGKFRDCASHSMKPLSNERIGRVIDMVSHLEDIDDVSEIVGLLG